MLSLNRPKVEKINAGKLSVDHTYQRDPVTARVRAIADDLDVEGLGVITVSRREDGTLVTIDGQHRIEALRQCGVVDETIVECRVYEELTLDEEAALYRHLNNTRAITSWDQFKAGIIAKDEDCLEIAGICRRNGLTVSKQVGIRRISCVACLKQIHKRYGSDVLDDTLSLVTSAWDATSNAVEKDIVHGAALVVSSHNGELDKGAMAKKLSRYKGGPARLLSNAKTLKDSYRTSVYKIIAQLMIGAYNSGSRTKRLDNVIDL